MPPNTEAPAEAKPPLEEAGVGLPNAPVDEVCPPNAEPPKAGVLAVEDAAPNRPPPADVVAAVFPNTEPEELEALLLPKSPPVEAEEAGVPPNNPPPGAVEA